LAPVAAATNGSVTYRFVAKRPGTFLYESGTNTDKQVQMGLYGAIIVRPAGLPDWAYEPVTGGQSTQFNGEFLLLFSELDPDMHATVEHGQLYDPTTYHPRYWLLNGRTFPDTLKANHTPSLPSQPQGSLILMQPNDPVNNPHPILMRYVNVGTRDHPNHVHGNMTRVIGRDGHPLTGSTGEDYSYEKFTVSPGPGETWDVLYSWTDVEQWSPTNPVPVVIPQEANLTYGMFYSGSPYLGVTEPVPPGTPVMNECGEFYQIVHSHSLIAASNWWAGGMGGMATLIRIDPPGGCK
jgi:FtsP/CotA-like multicopper oxidase with cupredoxin domain